MTTKLRFLVISAVVAIAGTMTFQVAAQTALTKCKDDKFQVHSELMSSIRKASGNSLISGSASSAFLADAEAQIKQEKSEISQNKDKAMTLDQCQLWKRHEEGQLSKLKAMMKAHK